MKKFTIRPLTPLDLPSIAELQKIYSRAYPDAPVIPGEVYLSPGFENGQNVFCAFDENGSLLGYAPLYPVLIREPSSFPHTIWAEIKVPLEEDAAREIKDELFEHLLVRSRELARDFPGHPIRLTFEYLPSETSSIDYVTTRGCRHTESIFIMRRRLSEEISSLPAPEGVRIRPWRMESQPEQQAYVAARNECFPDAPIELGEWQYFMQSPQWSVGTTFAAFYGDQLVGNVAVYWDETENQKSGRKIGFTEYIFVLPAWRGKNIARRLITAGLIYLKEHGLDEAQLSVRTKHEGALRLYTALGYEIWRESRFYVLDI